MNCFSNVQKINPTHWVTEKCCLDKPNPFLLRSLWFLINLTSCHSYELSFSCWSIILTVCSSHPPRPLQKHNDLALFDCLKDIASCLIWILPMPCFSFLFSSLSFPFHFFSFFLNSLFKELRSWGKIEAVTFSFHGKSEESLNLYSNNLRASTLNHYLAEHDQTSFSISGSP